MEVILSLSHAIQEGYFPNDPETAVNISRYDHNNFQMYQVLLKGGRRTNHIIVTEDLVPFMLSHGFEVNQILKDKYNANREAGVKHPILTSKYKNIMNIGLNTPIDNTVTHGVTIFNQSEGFLVYGMRNRPGRHDVQLYRVSGNMTVEYHRENPSAVLPDNLIFGEHHDELRNENYITLLDKSKN